MKPTEMLKKIGWDRNGVWANGPGPGHSKKDRSLGVRDDPNAPDGFRIHSLAEDEPNACRKHVKRLLQSAANLWPPELDAQGTNPAYTQTKLGAKGLDLWGEAEPIEGTAAAVYLKTRGCEPSQRREWPADLRFHLECPFGTLHAPALIGLARNVVTGEPVGIHRTALSDDGASKRMMPSGLPSRMVLGRASGAAIQLHQASSVLGLAEGIETALSAQKIFKVPVWAALSASGIRSFPVIHGVSRLFVFADNDGPGLAAARRCKRRYRDAGIETQIRHPSEYGTDWNDYLLKG
jgi:hypothetical protein